VKWCNLGVSLRLRSGWLACRTTSFSLPAAGRFGGKFFEFRKLGLNRHDLSLLAFCRFPRVDYVSHIVFEKFLLPFIDKSFSFSPKKPFQILAERRGTRREIASSNLHFPNWRCLFENIRTELAGLGGRNSPHTPLPPASP